MNYVIGGTLATFIGSSVLTHLIDGTIGIIYSSALFARHGTESNKVIQNIRIQIEELDIKIKLELVQKLLETLEKNDINDILEEGLIELMIKIKSTVEWIDYEIERHLRKWFAGYRSINIDDKLNDLRHLVKILDGRINLLMVSGNKKIN